MFIRLHIILLYHDTLKSSQPNIEIDIIDIYYLKNPDDRGVLYNIVNWFKLQADYQILYTLIIMAIIFIIIKLLNVVDWFKNLFNKK